VRLGLGCTHRLKVNMAFAHELWASPVNPRRHKCAMKEKKRKHYAVRHFSQEQLEVELKLP